MSRENESSEARVADVLRGRDEVQVAYAFGSRVTRSARRDSDIDVAVVLEPSLSPQQRFQLRCELSESIAAAAGAQSADVVDLEEASPLLAHEILRSGRLIFSRDESRRVRVTARQVMRFIDTGPMRRVLDDATFRRLRDGSFGRLA